jgi:periplasmic protein TonB
VFGDAPKKDVDAASPPARAAQHRSGTIGNHDYPTSALRARAEGRTSVRLQIGADGRVTGCAVEGTSGSSALDSTTCSLAQRRFRYTPAADAKGRPAAGTGRYEMNWRLPDETPDLSGTTPASD